MRKIIASELILLLGLVLLLHSPAYSKTQGVLQVIPDSVDFGEVEAYSTKASNATITISNCGDGDSVLCWDIRSDDCWICYVGDTSQGEIILPDEPRYENFTMCATGLCIAADKEPYEDITGVYKGSFTVYQYLYDESGTEGVCLYDSPPIDGVTVAATMTIAEFNVLEVEPTELDFGTVTENLTFKIKNTGQGDMNWQAVVSESSEWLTVNGGSSASGTVGTSQEETVMVAVDRSKLSGCKDEFSANIRVTSTNASPSEATVFVTMAKVFLPPQPSSPTPYDGALDQPLYTTLKWEESDTGEEVGDVVYFDVYFSTNRNLVDSGSPGALVCDDLTVPYCDPTGGTGQLDATTTYYWRVSAKDECNDNVLSGGVWSFTTGSAQIPVCPASVALQLNNREMGAIRSFRDEVLANTLAGEKYVDLYYSPHAIEALLILLFNPELRLCADRIVKESLPAIHALLKGEEATFKPGTIEEMELFLDEFGKAASPELKKIIGGIREHIKTGGLLKELGFSTVDR